MYLVNPPYLFKKVLNKKLVWEITTKKKEIFLTFDDGPTTELSPWILKTLKDFDAKATFFCVGNNVRKNPDLYEKILKDGHAVGNHTYDHLHGWKTKTKMYLRDIIKCDNYVKSSLFRPPYAKIRRKQIEGINNHFAIILWSVLSYDFDKKTSNEKCLENVLDNTKRGSIVVFHDNVKARENLYYTLPKFLEFFKNKKYTFKPLTKELVSNEYELQDKGNKLIEIVS